MVEDLDSDCNTFVVLRLDGNCLWMSKVFVVCKAHEEILTLHGQVVLVVLTLPFIFLKDFRRLNSCHRLRPALLTLTIPLIVRFIVLCKSTRWAVRS